MFFKKYDFFISYRRLSTNANIKDYRHCTSVARALALELKAKGYKVYVDLWEEGDYSSDSKHYTDILKNSDYAIVLLAEYSFDDGGGEIFRDELNYILKYMNEKSMWMNIDNRFNKNEKKDDDDDLKKKVKDRNKDILNTSRKELIVDIPGLKEIKKFPRISFKRAKWMSGVFGVLLLAAFVVLGVLIYRITRPDIIFVGGGTVKNYLDKMALSNGETIEDITRWFPNSKYIHIPSEDAIPVLLDIRNDSTAGSYTPIVFSSGRMMINKDAENKFMNEERRRIFELPVGKADLIVQIYDRSGLYRDSNAITVNTLRDLLLDSNNTVYTTSERSGTLNQYIAYLKQKDTSFVFSCIKKRKFFTPDNADSIYYVPQDKGKKIIQNNGIRIILGNEYYLFKGDGGENDTNLIKLKVLNDEDDTTKWFVPLYVYAASEVANRNCSYPMNSNVYKVLHFINPKITNEAKKADSNIFIQLN